MVKEVEDLILAVADNDQDVALKNAVSMYHNQIRHDSGVQWFKYVFETSDNAAFPKSNGLYSNFGLSDHHKSSNSGMIPQYYPPYLYYNIVEVSGGTDRDIKRPIEGLRDGDSGQYHLEESKFHRQWKEGLLPDDPHFRDCTESLDSETEMVSQMVRRHDTSRGFDSLTGKTPVMLPYKHDSDPPETHSRILCAVYTLNASHSRV